MSKPPPRLLVVLVFLAVLLARIHVAWVQQFSTDADRDIAQLMSKHVAEGGPWPVFFYGQGYMGSLEPLCGALFCKLFGVGPFQAALGTALPAFLAALVVWFMARTIAGPWAGLYAAAATATASPAFAAFMGNPRGGYAMVALLGTWCLYLAGRLAAREWSGARPSPAWYGLLGLVAGAAWWTSGIVAAILAASALAVFVGLRGRVLNLRILAGLAGFLAGAAPWLIWNAQNDWLSMSMSKSLGAMRLSQSVPFLLRRLWEAIGLGTPEWPPYLLGFLMVAFIIAGLVIPLREARQQKQPEPFFHLGTLVVFILLFATTYVISSFARIETLRYVLPLVPVLAILFGVAWGPWTRRLPVYVHAVLLALLLGGQLLRGEIRGRPDEVQREAHARAYAFGAEARSNGYDAIFAWYGLHWMNFASREAVPVVDNRGERYPPYARAGLLAEKAMWVADPQGFQYFLRDTAATYKSTASHFGLVIYDVEPPTTAWAPVPTSRVARITSADATTPADLVQDGNLATAWRTESRQDKPSELVVELNEPTPLLGLKLYSADGRYPLYLALDIQAEDGGPWVEVQAPRYVNRYHWSGPMPYWENLYYTVEARFAPVTAHALRIRFPPSAKRESYRIRLSELALLQSRPGTPDARPDASQIPTLLDRLNREGVTELLADRWVSDRIAAATGHTVRVRHSADLDRKLDDPPKDDDPIYTLCDLTTVTALLAAPGPAETIEDRLRAEGFRVRRETTPLGELLLLNDPANEGLASRGPLAWFGDALFTYREPGDEIFYAHSLYQQALRTEARDPQAALSVLEHCLATDPDHAPALQRWLDWTPADHPDRAARADRLDRLLQPARPYAVRFANGMRFEGLRVEPAQAAPGSTVRLTYYWRAPREVNYRDLNVFVHVRQERLAWQDDHPALAGLTEARIRRQPTDSPLLVTREMAIPAGAKPGTYSLVLGLVDRSDAKRVWAWGRGARWNRSILVPDAFTVTGPP